MIIEKTGYEMTGHLYIGLSDARKHVERVAADNARKRRANRRITRALKKLERTLRSKTRQLARTDDTAKKVELQEAIDTLTDEVEGKKEECEPLASVYGPRRFAKEVDARAFIEQAARQLAKLKEKAEARKAKEEEKAAKKSEKDTDKT